jgi:hypothetical protein
MAEDLVEMTTEPEPVELPTVQVANRPLRDITADTFAALVVANSPPVLFQRLGRLARVRVDEHGRPSIETANEAIVRHRLARVAEFVTVTSRRGEVVVPPPDMVVADLLAHETWLGIPALEAVTEVPVLRPDGSVFDTPGYDERTRLVYVPPPSLVIPRVPAAPTAEQVQFAVATAWDILAQFPFADGASAANALALLLTPILRPAIAGPVPLALIDKPKRGTGATLFAQVIEAVAIGNTTDLTTAPKDDEEWRKKITSALLAGTTIMFFDNVEHALSSPSLAAALTTAEWSDRILGRSEMARSLPQRATWMATGNNLKVGGDLARRCYIIRLDAQVARPWMRDGFRHKRLMAHVLGQRGVILHALLTLVRAWFAAGCPVSPNVPAIGTFDEWAKMVGGILHHAGVSRFLENLDGLYQQVDEEEVAWEAFLAIWSTDYGDRPVTVGEVTTALRTEGRPLREALPSDLAEALPGDDRKSDGSFRKRFGKALAKRADAVFGSLRLERAGTDDHAHAVRWRVVEARRSGFGGFAGFPSPISCDAGSPVPGEGGDADTPPVFCWTCGQGGHELNGCPEMPT